MKNITTYNQKEILANTQFAIAFGRDRKEPNWENAKMNWSEFVTKCSKTCRTSETIAEYINMDKAQQDQIKDVGGFVAGFLENGRRSINSIVFRTLITLDADFSIPRLWDLFVKKFKCASLIYSTHKHQSNMPRHRLVILLDREVSPDEYQAIARHIALQINIEIFDDTTFQAERMMYWPSTSIDGEYEFKHQEEAPLKADKILACYENWNDSSTWPFSNRDKSVRKRNIKLKGDPLEKPGLIGAFNNSYSIEAAIEAYLSDIYEPCDIADRFSYIIGTTSGGLVIYDGKFAYSFHSTDPISGILCNAFDLVRLHLFGTKDKDCIDGTPINKLPSQLAMEDLCNKNTIVLKELMARQLSNAKSDFLCVDVNGLLNKLDTDWSQKLTTDKRGKIDCTIPNAVVIFEYDENLRGKFGYNQFVKSQMALADLPWRKITKLTMSLTNADRAQIRNYFERKYQFYHPCCKAP